MDDGSAPEAHHVLREKGLLHEWQPGRGGESWKLEETVGSKNLKKESSYEPGDMGVRCGNTDPQGLSCILIFRFWDVEVRLSASVDWAPPQECL